MSNEQEVEKEMEFLVWHKWECGARSEKEIIGDDMTRHGGQTFSQQDMSAAINKMKENKAADYRLQQYYRYIR